MRVAPVIILLDFVVHLEAYHATAQQTFNGRGFLESFVAELVDNIFDSALQIQHNFHKDLFSLALGKTRPIPSLGIIQARFPFHMSHSVPLAVPSLRSVSRGPLTARAEEQQEGVRNSEWQQRRMQRRVFLGLAGTVVGLPKLFEGARRAFDENAESKENLKAAVALLEGRDALNDLLEASVGPSAETWKKRRAQRLLPDYARSMVALVDTLPVVLQLAFGDAKPDGTSSVVDDDRRRFMNDILAAAEWVKQANLDIQLGRTLDDAPAVGIDVARLAVVDCDQMLALLSRDLIQRGNQQRCFELMTDAGGLGNLDEMSDVRASSPVCQAVERARK